MKKYSFIFLCATACGQVSPPTSNVEAPKRARAAAATADTASESSLVFTADWQQYAKGTLTAGASVQVDYDASRLPGCRASHDGYPGWQITANIESLPSGTVNTQGLFQHTTSDGGTDLESWVETQPTFTIPEGTTSLAVWFELTSGFDEPCDNFDSNYGNNYSFSVAN